MLVSHAHEFVHLKTHKTAGTSIEMFLQPFCQPAADPVHERTHAEVGPRGIVGMRAHQPRDHTALDRLWYNHMPAALVRERLGTRVFDRYLKIAACRNPFERAVSHFYFRVARNLIPFPQGIDEARAKVAEFVTSDAFQDDRKIVFIDDAVVIDRFIRYESLGQDLRRIALDLGCDLARTVLPRTKKSRHAWLGTISEHFTQAGIKAVRDRCAWMFDLCGYAREPVDAPDNGGVRVEGADRPVGQLVEREI